MINLMLVISNLTYGGAERQVVELANQLDKSRFNVHICILSTHAPLAEGLSGDVVLHKIPKHTKFDIGVVFKLASLMRKLSINVVHGFLYDAEIATRLAGKLAGVDVVVGSERNSSHDYGTLKLKVYRLTSRLMSVCVANSETGKRYNMSMCGLNDARYRVVYNGVDTERFQPRSKTEARTKLDLPNDRFVMGMVGSFKRQKNHPYLIETLARLKTTRSDFCMVIVGTTIFEGDDDSADYFAALNDLIVEHELTQHVRLIGARSDVETVYNACDITLLPSLFEGTPNVALESLSSGVPVIATDVSDNSIVIPDQQVGFIVPLAEPDIFAERIHTLLGSDAMREHYSTSARNLIESRFSVPTMVDNMAAIYTELQAAEEASS